jgi:diguanylate cyclase (GGDEF)-like protein
MLLLPTGILAAGPDGAEVAAVAGSLVIVLLLMRAVAAVRDHARAESKLREQAATDPLTGLANRSRVVELVDGLLERARGSEGDHVDLLFLDLDSFKFVNDTWGHQVGDRMLNLAAERLREVTASTDLVARIGGDEFVVVRYVGAYGARGGEVLAAAILDEFRRPPLDDDVFSTTVSIGISSSRPEVSGTARVTAESLLRDADTAMYRAKGAGRNRSMTFDPSMHDTVRRRVETELALRYALERNELLLHYQPIVCLQTGQVVGAEALLRWAHPALGMVPPLDFVPVAEETGMIVEIGEWVVSEAVRQLARWRDQRSSDGRSELWMAVNISPRQLRDPSLVDHVRDELARSGVPPEQLILEITETAMMADEELANGILLRLRALGVTLAVDDFGTGYSSLGHLRRYPVSKVKIDRAFVAGIEDDADDAEIVRAVVAMSLAMRLDVVAEGIETEGQRDLLRRIGVQLGQGWLFGRPAPAEDCEFVLAQPAWLKS